MIALLPVLAATLAAVPAEPSPPPLPEVVTLPALAPRPLPETVTLPALSPPVAAHHFWDWQNLALFSGVAGARAFDYFSTRNFREKHLKEWLLDDKTVDNRPLFAAIEVGGAAISIGASYLLHRAGYHRLERWASILHITFATAGGIWNLTLPNGL